MSVGERAPERSKLIAMLEATQAEKKELGRQHVAAIAKATEAEAKAKAAWEAAVQNLRRARRDKSDAIDPLTRRVSEVRALLDDATPPEIHELIDRIDRAIRATEATELPTRQTVVHKGAFAQATVESLCDSREVNRVRGRVIFLRQLRTQVLALTYQDSFSDALTEATAALDVQPKRRRFSLWPR